MTQKEKGIENEEKIEDADFCNGNRFKEKMNRTGGISAEPLESLASSFSLLLPDGEWLLPNDT